MSNKEKLYKYLGETSVQCQELIKNYLPEYGFEIKQNAFEKALRIHSEDSGLIAISRVECSDYVSESSLRKAAVKVTLDDSFYNYEKSISDSTEWYVNFADPFLFIAYDSSLFAQDEIQTLEMPLLAACCRYLDETNIKGLMTKTVEGKTPTPFLFRNVPYWIRINTRPVLKDGSIGNIYGNNLEYASAEELETGIRTYEGNARVNVLAIAAPNGGRGRYTGDQIIQILQTLICAFSAVKNQSSLKTVIHSGNWGCGAFGGNKELMYLAQIYAASICGIDELIIHDADVIMLDRAKNVFQSLPKEMLFSEITEFISAKDYTWGTSDGN